MTAFIIVGSLAIIVGLIIYSSIANQKWHQENRGQETITETEHFYWHLFYFNSEDHRIFVPKQTGGGFTINFASPAAVIIIVLIITGYIMAIRYL